VKIPKTRGMRRRQARAWLVRTQSGRDPAAELKFRYWVESDPRNAAAFEGVRRNFEQAGLLRQSPSSRARELHPENHSIAAKRQYAWAAAAMVLLIVPAVWLLAEHGAIIGGTDAMMLVTHVGEVRHIDLEDGSKLVLDTASSVEVDIGRAHRSAVVKRGRARFEIVHGQAPFVVQAGNATVTSDGSSFDVALEAQQTGIDVVSGRADVRNTNNAASTAQIIRAGEIVAATASGVRQTEAPAGGTQWVRGMLQFDGTPLETAVEVANRYSEHKIVLSGELGQERVTGAFRTGDVPGLAKALAAAFHLSLVRAHDGELFLSPQDERDRRK
jgi:transmembrane sensor